MAPKPKQTVKKLKKNMPKFMPSLKKKKNESRTLLFDYTLEHSQFQVFQEVMTLVLKHCAYSGT